MKSGPNGVTWIERSNWKRSSAGTTTTGETSIRSAKLVVEGHLGFFSRSLTDNPRVKRMFCRRYELLSTTEAQNLDESPSLRSQRY